MKKYNRFIFLLLALLLSLVGCNNNSSDITKVLVRNTAAFDIYKISNSKKIDKITSLLSEANWASKPHYQNSDSNSEEFSLYVFFENNSQTNYKLFFNRNNTADITNLTAVAASNKKAYAKLNKKDTKSLKKLLVNQAKKSASK
jgi:uncharacterized lipoprotein NlpE involved in copper resistance